VTLSVETLAAEAHHTGFEPMLLEKVAHLLSLLNALREQPTLRNKLVLKGGTALNLFVFEVPRLSVDIDLNYVGDEGRDDMLADRPPRDCGSAVTRGAAETRKSLLGPAWDFSSDSRLRLATPRLGAPTVR
jgi:predicted nucleotidyltransferase component of viral defense system